ncbi:hypothetical protein CK203_067948 [Vitis vinifera]|uniref:Uncharacterized protein n=1 Tax=Vitis vinifera TaxID=29760 RepID=A0A438EW35_VITVI|nr:hypothetical protein CK203_067948 [Vitis vinifera]
MSSGHPNPGKPTELLNEQEFREHFFIPNGISVQLVEEDPTSTKKAAHNTIFFSKEQFNVGLDFPLLSIFKQFLHYTQIPLAHIHSNIVQVLMGWNILNMLFHLDLSLLELVTSLLDLNKGGAKGHVLVRGPWAGLIEHLERDFHPNYSLKIPGKDKRGRLVEWVEEASFICLNKLFEIIASERNHQTLISARNLLADLPFYKEACEADAKARHELLEQQEEKRHGGGGGGKLRRAPREKASNSADSSVQAFEGDSDSLRLDPNNPGTYHFELELEPITLRFIDEPEAEKDMLADLRPILRRGIANVSMRLSIWFLLQPKRLARRGLRRSLGESGTTPVEEVLDQKDTPASALPPSWDEMMDMLKRVSCFTDAEPPSTKMSDFFPLTNYSYQGISLYVIRLEDLLDNPFVQLFQDVPHFHQILSLKAENASARFNLDIIASYSASLLDAGNPSRMGCSNCSPIGDRRRRPTPDPEDRRPHQFARSTIPSCLIPCLGGLLGYLNYEVNHDLSFYGQPRLGLVGEHNYRMSLEIWAEFLSDVSQG